MKRINTILSIFLGLLTAGSISYAQTTYNFTRAGASGYQGPTQSQVNSTYSGTALNNAVTINTRGVQEWTVPATGVYTIEAWGAAGTNSSDQPAGYGARMKGDFSLSDELLLKNKENEFKLTFSRHGLVLLKNDNMLLPLKKQNQKIAIIGQLANDKNSTLGNWRSQVENNSAVSVVEGMKKYNGNKTIYEKGVDLYYGETNFHNRVKLNFNDRSDFGKAKLAAASSDIVIMVLGEEGHQSGEGRSRTNIAVSYTQLTLPTNREV